MSLETPGDVGARLDKLKDVRGQLVWRALCSHHRLADEIPYTRTSSFFETRETRSLGT